MSAAELSISINTMHPLYFSSAQFLFPFFQMFTLISSKFLFNIKSNILQFCSPDGIILWDKTFYVRRYTEKFLAQPIP